MNNYNFDSYINSPLLIQEELLSLFEKSKDIVIFDIGACEGEDTIRYSKLFHNSTIYAFEPLPNNFKRASDNLLKYGINNASIHRIALCDRNGSSKFYVSSGRPHGIECDTQWDFGNKSSSLLSPTKAMKESFSWLNFGEEIEVPTQTLESFCSNSAISQIDFIHLDVQGAELMVLKGAGELLKSTKCIWLEVENSELYSRQPLKDDVEAFMVKNKFKKIKDFVGDISGDQLYVRG